jgi:import inner membrane translocase subunit TIM21
MACSFDDQVWSLYPSQKVFESSFAVRPLSTSAARPSPAADVRKQGHDEPKDGKSALTVEQEGEDAITDQIPQRPVSVAEGTSYTIIIIAAIGFAGKPVMGPMLAVYGFLRPAII